MPRLLPERTVDSLLAYELLRAHPSGVLWSPTNTAGSFDHEFAVGTVTLIVECKGVADEKRGRWRLPFDQPQLDRYLTGPLANRVLYVFPAQPGPGPYPWVRECACDPSNCLACRQGGPADHRLERRWAGMDPSYTHVGGALRPMQSLFQAWFNHWTWCISAADLAHVVPPDPAGRRDLRVDGTDAFWRTNRHAVRLCHYLDAMGGGPAGPSGPGPDGGPSGGTDGGPTAVNQTPEVARDPAEADIVPGGDGVQQSAAAEEAISLVRKSLFRRTDVDIEAVDRVLTGDWPLFEDDTPPLALFLDEALLP